MVSWEAATRERLWAGGCPLRLPGVPHAPHPSGELPRLLVVNARAQRQSIAAQFGEQSDLGLPAIKAWLGLRMRCRPGCQGTRHAVTAGSGTINASGQA